MMVNLMSNACMRNVHIIPSNPALCRIFLKINSVLLLTFSVFLIKFRFQQNIRYRRLLIKKDVLYG